MIKNKKMMKNDDDGEEILAVDVPGCRLTFSFKGWVGLKSLY